MKICVAKMIIKYKILIGTIMENLPINIIIKNRRIELGYTLEFVANKLGVAKSTVLRWENGETTNIKIYQFNALCEILFLDPKFVLNSEEGEAPEAAEIVLKRKSICSKLGKIKTLEDLNKIDALIEVFKQ